MAASFAGPADSYKSFVLAQRVKLIALGQCVFHCQDQQPKSNCLLQPRVGPMGRWGKCKYMVVVHRRNVCRSQLLACKSRQLWQRKWNSCRKVTWQSNICVLKKGVKRIRKQNRKHLSSLLNVAQVIRLGGVANPYLPLRIKYFWWTVSQ